MANSRGPGDHNGDGITKGPRDHKGVKGDHNEAWDDNGIWQTQGGQGTTRGWNHKGAQGATMGTRDRKGAKGDHNEA